jgi:hypothetical protein
MSGTEPPDLRPTDAVTPKRRALEIPESMPNGLDQLKEPAAVSRSQSEDRNRRIYVSGSTGRAVSGAVGGCAYRRICAA